MTIQTQAKVEGHDELVKTLAGFKKSLRNKWNRRGVTKASRVIAKDAKGRTRHKEVKKALGQKVKTYSSGVVVGIIGPRSGRKAVVPVKPERVYRTINGRRVRIRQPLPEQLKQEISVSRLARREEFGSAASGPANPFLRPAFEANKKEAQEIIAREIRAGIEEEAKKATTKGGKK